MDNRISTEAGYRLSKEGAREKLGNFFVRERAKITPSGERRFLEINYVGPLLEDPTAEDVRFFQIDITFLTPPEREGLRRFLGEFSAPKDIDRKDLKEKIINELSSLKAEIHARWEKINQGWET